MEVVRVVVLEIHVKCARIVDLLARLISRLIGSSVCVSYEHNRHLTAPVMQPQATSVSVHDPHGNNHALPCAGLCAVRAHKTRRAWPRLGMIRLAYAQHRQDSSSSTANIADKTRKTGASDKDVCGF